MWCPPPRLSHLNWPKKGSRWSKALSQVRSERREVLLAQGVHVHAVDQLDMLLGQLVDREAEPRMGGAGIVARHFTFGMQGIDPQANIETLPPRPRRLDDRAAAHDLLRRVEDDMVGQAQDFVEVVGLVGGRIGGDLAVIELAGQPRFPQARGADPVEIFADQRRDAPHRERLERGRAFLCRPGRGHRRGWPGWRAVWRRPPRRRGYRPGEVELGECAWVSGSGFHASRLAVLSIFAKHKWGGAARLFRPQLGLAADISARHRATERQLD